MTTAELLDKYWRLLEHDGPDSDAAYNLLTTHLDHAEFIQAAEQARSWYTQRRQAIRLLLLLAPFYIALATLFGLMIWLG